MGPPVVTLHVVREFPGRTARVLPRHVTDRWRLRRCPGLRFARVLGTGREDDTGPSADLSRQAYLVVWEDRGALDRFVSEHRIARRWRQLDRVIPGWHDELLLVAGHGRWGGHDLLAGLPAVEPGPGDEVIVITRARLRPRSWWRFRSVSRELADEVIGTPGLVDVIGVGELPVGLLGTISRWRSTAAIDEFLKASEPHRAAMALADRWFAESLFARFVARALDLGAES